MTTVALGVQMHSGWGVLVAVSADPVTLLVRRRIVVADAETPGAIQPYHFAAGLPPPEQEKHIAHCADASSCRAATAIAEVMEELRKGRHRIVGAAVLLASGRPLPALPKILAAHPPIHSAEGEFFRQSAARAFETLHIPVTAMRERELEQLAASAFGKKTIQMQSHIAGLASAIGPPWTKDHKTAALAAALILAAC
jgi:hypothetical protein